MLVALYFAVIGILQVLFVIFPPSWAAWGRQGQNQYPGKAPSQCWRPRWRIGIFPEKKALCFPPFLRTIENLGELGKFRQHTNVSPYGFKANPLRKNPLTQSRCGMCIGGWGILREIRRQVVGASTKRLTLFLLVPPYLPPKQNRRKPIRTEKSRIDTKAKNAQKKTHYPKMVSLSLWLQR